MPPAATAARGGSRAHARPDCHAREDMHTPLARDNCEAGPGRRENCRADGQRVSGDRGARCQRGLLDRVGSRRQLVRPIRPAVQCVCDSFDGGRSLAAAAAAARPHRANPPKMSSGRLLARVPFWRAGDALSLHTTGEDGLASSDRSYRYLASIHIWPRT